MSRIQDLTCKKFGKLTVIEKTDKRYHGSVFWKCKCDCGNIVDVLASRLKSGNTRSCGCLQNGFNDLSGKRFGKLTVIEQTSKREYGNIIWKCKCDCGNSVLVRGDSLTSGATTSCGCVGLEKLKEFRENNYILDTNISKISSSKPSKNSTSGVKGVYWISTISKWEVQIEFKKHCYHLGRYENKNKAMRIRKLAEEKLFGNFLKWYKDFKESNK